VAHPGLGLAPTRSLLTVAGIQPQARHAAFRQRERLYRELLPTDFRPRQILDVGGTLATVTFLRERFPDASITVQNIRAEDLEPISGSNILTRRASAERLPDNDGSFDLVFLGEVLEHMIYPNEFLAEAARVLRVGGLILLSTPNLASWHNRILLAFGYSPSNYSPYPERHLGLPRPLRGRLGLGYGDHIRVFTFKALRQLFDEAPWRLLGITAMNCSDEGHAAARLRRFLEILPASAREDVFVCAANDRTLDFHPTGPPVEAGRRGYVGSVRG